MVTIDDIRSSAEDRIVSSNHFRRDKYNYLEKAAGQGKTYQSNLDAFAKYQLVPRVLVGKAPDTHVWLHADNSSLATPIMLAPTAWHKMFHEDGEAATSKAAYRACTKMIASFYSNSAFEEMGADLGHLWFNLLPYKDEKLMMSSIETAANAGCKAIVLTVDAPMGCKGSASFAYPIEYLPLVPKKPDLQFTDIGDYYRKYVDSAAGWEYVSNLTKNSPLPIILKGILNPADVYTAQECGAKAVIISNHGGRQMDGTIGTLDALANIHEFVKQTKNKPSIDMYLDGGIRSGQDVFKALALGAKAVLIGRPAIYGLVHNGEDGVKQVIDILTTELKETMHMCGAKRLSFISPDMVYKVK